jgi:ubiquinone/menaquinone biosynthesis C-methylase UbiE
MKINDTWSSKTILKHVDQTRSSFQKLYRGEKYLISNFIKKNDSVLDIGCGQGGLYRILKKKFKKIKYTGIDFNSKMIEIAKTKYPSANFFLYKKNNYLNFFKKKFDIIIIFGILHLNKNWKKILLNAAKITKKKILFDHRIEYEKSKKKNYYLDLDFKNKKKKFRIKYILLKKNMLKNFLHVNFKKFKIKKLNYNGEASKFSNIKQKITFANIALIK